MLNLINNIFDIYKQKYKELTNVDIKFVNKINIASDLCGATNCDIIGEYVYVGKMRRKKIIPKEILIVDDKNLNEEKIKFILFHEIAHCLCDHIERKVKNKWIIYDHSNIFYDKYIEVVKYAIKNNIIINKYNKIDHNLLKHIDDLI